MKKISTIFALFAVHTLIAQVYNFGANEITFKNLVNNGVTYVKTGNTVLDSTIISNLEKYWTFSDFSVVELYKRPEKTSTALFITTKEITRKHAMDRKNQHVLVLQPAELYVPRKKVNMEQTLGYMYLNGFYDLVAEKDEYKFSYMLVKALNQGLYIIKNKRLLGEPKELNELVATEITGTDGPSVGNTLILNREQTRHAINKESLDKLNIKYRLLAEEEYYKALDKKDPNHIILYFAVNRFTELALVRISNGEMLYAKHFRETYTTIAKKELKIMAAYFH